MSILRGVWLLVALLVIQSAALATVQYVPITGDGDSQISSGKTYTHVLDFGSGTAGTVNGVAFTGASANMPGVFTHTVVSGTGAPTTHIGNSGHNVTGGLVDVLTDMVYTGSNSAGAISRSNVQGLTVGQYYDLRIYTRRWGANPTGRDADLTFSNGVAAENVTVGTIDEDDATQTPPGLATANQAYFISYRYLAKSTSATVDFHQFNTNQSWHLYALSNEVITPVNITTLFSTGVDANGQLLPSGSADPHYDLIAAASNGGSPAPEFKIKHPAWLSEAAPDDDSGWIGPENGVTSVPTGAYTYQTTFDLSAYDHTTARVQFRVAVDDSLLNVLINGQSLGITAGGHGAWSSTFTIDQGFVAGLNTLTFNTSNGGTTGNPAGLRVDIVSATALAAIPEPASLAMIALALAALPRRR